MISRPSVRALDVETRWALKIVMMHASCRFSLNLNELFMVIFPDSDIVENFKMSKTKVFYTTLYGIAEYFHCSLLSLLRKSQLLHHYLTKVLMTFYTKFRWTLISVSTMLIQQLFLQDTEIFALLFVQASMSCLVK